MNLFVIFLNLILIIFSISNLTILVNIYFKSYDKRHYYFLMTNFSLLITSMVLFVNYIINNTPHLIFNNELYLKLFISYLTISILLTVYFFIKYFLISFNFKFNFTCRSFFSVQLTIPVLKSFKFNLQLQLLNLFSSLFSSQIISVTVLAHGINIFILINPSVIKIWCQLGLINQQTETI